MNLGKWTSAFFLFRFIFFSFFPFTFISFLTLVLCRLPVSCVGLCFSVFSFFQFFIFFVLVFVLHFLYLLLCCSVLHRVLGSSSTLYPLVTKRRSALRPVPRSIRFSLVDHNLHAQNIPSLINPQYFVCPGSAHTYFSRKIV